MRFRPRFESLEQRETPTGLTYLDIPIPDPTPGGPSLPGDPLPSEPTDPNSPYPTKPTPQPDPAPSVPPPE